MNDAPHTPPSPPNGPANPTKPPEVSDEGFHVGLKDQVMKQMLEQRGPEWLEANRERLERECEEYKNF